MDFIIGFPKVIKCSKILVMVDRFNKYVVCILESHNIDGHEIA